jgi:hypothetical protein
MGLDTSTSIPITLPTGTFNIWDESRGEETSEGGPVREVLTRDTREGHAVWNILAMWSDRIPIAGGLLGSTTTISGAPVYLPPAPYPNIAKWICNKIEIKGLGLITPGSGLNYIGSPKYARMTVMFGPPEYDPKGSNGLMVGELGLEFASNAIALAQNAVSFVWTDGTALPSSLYPTLRTTTVVAGLTLYDRGTLNQNLITSYLDAVNEDEFQGYAPETMILRGARSDRRMLLDGTLNYNTNLIWEVTNQTYTWNQIWRPVNGGSPSGWQDFRIAGAPVGGGVYAVGSKLFPPMDFTQLLK